VHVVLELRQRRERHALGDELRPPAFECRL